MTLKLHIIRRALLGNEYVLWKPITFAMIIIRIKSVAYQSHGFANALQLFLHRVDPSFRVS
jgi:hypothetical protein